MKRAALLSVLIAPTCVLAATLDVQVLGADGKPLADAVVFLESREARAALKPATGIEVEQTNRKFTDNRRTLELARAWGAS